MKSYLQNAQGTKEEYILFWSVLWKYLSFTKINLSCSTKGMVKLNKAMAFSKVKFYVTNCNKNFDMFIRRIGLYKWLLFYYALGMKF